MNPAVVHLIAGARPNFMKIAPIVRELKLHPRRFIARIVHTGQHYDAGMSGVFFQELGIPQPDHHLGAGGGSHAEQTGRIMLGYEQVCAQQRPDLVIVVGDVNSTLACSIVAKKLCIPVAHVEAGLRSGDLTMPEEINRLVTDSISDYFFITEPSGVENLLREGKAESSLFFVGHVMIDNLFHQIEALKRIDTTTFPSDALKRGLPDYGVVTLHRPSNVDTRDALLRIIGALAELSTKLPLIFPVHPRTASNLQRFAVKVPDSIHMLPPLAYMEFLSLWKDARLILTDSGGIQEESTALGVPCITLRDNTERPVTVTEGTNVLAGTDPQRIAELAAHAMSSERAAAIRRPALWDGLAAKRIVAHLESVMASFTTADAA